MKALTLNLSEECTTFSSISMKDIIPKRLKNGVRSFLVHRSLKFLRTYYSGLASCVLYHRVGPQKFNSEEFSPYSGLTVTKESFDEQVRYYKENYNCLALPQAIDLLNQGTLPPNSLVITFDDGYKDNMTNALPILEKYEVPATIYVTTGLVDRTAELWWFEQEFIIRNCQRIEFEWEGAAYHWQLQTPEEKYSAIERLNFLFKSITLHKQKSFMKTLRSQCAKSYSYDHEIMTWDEVKAVDKHPLITIGAHTINHPMLTLLEGSEVQMELRESKARLEAEFGHSVEHFAYPFGGVHEVGRREFEAARECKFASAVTTRHGHLYKQHQNHLHSLPRVSVNYDDSLEALAWKLSGMHSMLQQRGKRIVTG